jgi:uncharacterized membrane protein YedE/YeeE
MSIDTSNFTPIASLAGGILIGISATLMLLLNGRITGISGIIRLTLERTLESAWRIAFIAGLLISPLIYRMIFVLPDTFVTHNPLLLTIAGALVGIGTNLASGCTSGHGICGIARLSWRSMVAVTVFMSTAFITVFLTHH